MSPPASASPLLRTAVQSFDLFDTLLARRCITPAALFAEVGAACGRRDFAAARIAAEHLSAAAGSFDIETIYRTLHRIGYCDAAQAHRLMAAEIDAEFDNAVPIAANLATVRDFDLVISDMYLPADILRRLLQHVGLRRPVHLLVSNAGKRLGHVWADLGQRWLIRHHIGDNREADVDVPQRFGIPTVHYTGAAPTDTETYLDDAGLPTLARLTRQLRLANPHPAASLEGALWNHFVGLNLPLLVLASAEAVERRRAGGHDKLLLVERDCHFLSEVLGTLFAGEPTRSVHVSRAALADPEAGAAAYLAAAGLGNGLVCDLVSTGLSWLRFSQATGMAVNLFALVCVDNYQYRPFDCGELERQPGFRFWWATQASRIGNFSKAIEALNTAPHGSTLSLQACGDTFLPRFAESHELPTGLLNVLTAAQGAAVARLRTCRKAVADEAASLSPRQDVLEVLVRTLCAPSWLNGIARNI